MFEAIGHPVLKLRRERYAFLTLQGLRSGDARELTAHEVKQLRVMAENIKTIIFKNNKDVYEML